MKPITFILAAFAALAGVRDAAAKPGYSITGDFTFASKNVFRGVQNAGKSFQPSVEFVTGGLNAGVWTNQPGTKREHDEVDLYAGYTYSVNSALKFDSVATFYWYPEARKTLGETQRTYEAGVSATYSAGGFASNLYYYHDFRLGSDTLEAAIGYSVPVGNAWSVDTGVFCAGVAAQDAAPDAGGPVVHDRYTYYGVEVNVPYRLNARASVTIGVHYADTHGLRAAKGSAGDNNLWYTAGVSIGF
ncbi:MAG: hypothetical protein EXS39_07245 [Opitutaceae bacterium]|nr:hypothetical protein [Opitutaceae bacterium]